MEWLFDLLSNLFCLDPTYLMAFNALSSIENFGRQVYQEAATEREYKAFAGADSPMLKYTKPYLDKYNIPVYSQTTTYEPHMAEGQKEYLRKIGVNIDELTYTSTDNTRYNMSNPKGTSAATLKKAYLEFLSDYGMTDNMHDTSDKEYFRLDPSYRTGYLEDAEYGISETIKDIDEMRKASNQYQAEQQAAAEAAAKKAAEELAKQRRELQSIVAMRDNQARAQQQSTSLSTTTQTGIDGRRRAIRQQNEKHTGGSLGVKNMGILGTMGYGGSLGSGLY